MPVIYLRPASPRGLYRSTLRLGRATLSLSSPVYMNFQLPECTAPRVATGLVGSYPAFSPLPAQALRPRLGGCFLLHGLTLASLFPLGSGMPCVARTFLSPHVFRGPATGRSTVSRGQRYEKKSGNTNLFDSSSDSLGFEKASLRAERPSGSAAFTHSLHHAVKRLHHAVKRLHPGVTRPETAVNKCKIARSLD